METIFLEEEMANLAVLVSGNGSLLEAMLQDGLKVSLVLADRKCRGREIAHSAGITTAFCERTNFTKSFNRREYTLSAIEHLKLGGADLLAMAGFMTIFSPEMFDAFPGRVLNTHPSLLPAFKGDRAVEDALKYGVKVSGCTVHIATSELDSGPILGQSTVRVYPRDTVTRLHERIKKMERVLYPRIIREQLDSL